MGYRDCQGRGPRSDSDPVTVLEADRQRFAKLWCAIDSPHDPNNADARAQSQHVLEEACADTDDLPRLDHRILRRASASFSHKTSTSYDGLHPRHFAMLSDDALDAIGELLMCIEGQGHWPAGIDAVTMALIPKPKGGTRLSDCSEACIACGPRRDSQLPASGRRITAGTTLQPARATGL